MNSRNLKTILFIIIGVLVLGVFLRILPYLIAGGIVIYLANKCYNYIKLKLNKDEKKKSSSFDYSSKYDIKNQNDEDDFDISNAIDVDYKDIK